MARKSYRKDTWEKKGARIGGNVGAIASKVKNIIDELNVEKKYNDITIGATVGTAGAIYSLNTLAQGTGAVARDGNSIKLTSLQIRHSVVMNPTAVTNTFRIIVFQDLQEVLGTNPAVTDVLQTASFLAPLNRARAGRFKVLSEHVFLLSATGSQIAYTKEYKKLSVHQHWSDSTSTNIEKNGIYVLAISDQNVNVSTYNAYCRLTFVDN